MEIQASALNFFPTSNNEYYYHHHLSTFFLPCSYNHPLLSVGTFFFFNLFILFIYFWLCWVFIAVRAFSSCVQRGLLYIAVSRLLIVVASLVEEHGL